MRWCAACVLLAGCNQIFGLKPTKEFDAALGDAIPEAPLPHVQLTWQVATLKPTGEPADTVGFAPIAPAPKVRIAPKDGAFVDATYGADGSIEYPQSFVGAPWRIEYTIGVDAPVEVQWQPPDGQGHLIVPLFGRVDRNTPPINGGYTITAVGASGFSLPRVFTTGMWTETTSAHLTINTNRVDMNFANAVPLSGNKGAPDSAQGDRGLLVDFQNLPSGCRHSVGSADFAPDLMDSLVMVMPTWMTRVRTPTVNVGVAELGRVADALGPGLTGTAGGDQLVGYVPSVLMPGFSASNPPLLPAPLMLAMAQCPSSAMVPTVNAPVHLEDKMFPRVAHVQLTNHRTVGGTTLTSAIEADVLPKTSTPTTDLFNVTFPAALATKPLLQTPSQQMIDLVGASDNIPLTPASGTYVLSFTAESGAYSIDYSEVTLHEIVGTSLMPVRTFTFTGTSVAIDGASFAAGKRYVFEIRTHVGAPTAAQGDFTQVAFPQGLAIVFTRTIQT